VNEHNGWVPRDFWLETWEKEAIISFHLKNRLEGYRRLTFMMLTHSPASKKRLRGERGQQRRVGMRRSLGISLVVRSWTQS
jgi:putative transposase